MDNPKFIVSNQKEESISIQRVDSNQNKHGYLILILLNNLIRHISNLLFNKYCNSEFLDCMENSADPDQMALLEAS